MVKPAIRGTLTGTALILVTFGAGRAMQYPAAIGRPTADTVPGLGAGHGQEDIPEVAREMRAHQLKMLRELHQKEVFDDSDRLLKLATELKAETDHGATATPGELKDVDEIARLAKRLSQRIKNQ